jgi:hypothetical protein
MKGNITKMKDFSSQVLPAVTIDFLFHDLYRRSFPQRLDPELLRRYNFYNPIPEGFVRCSFIAIGFLHCSSRRLHFFSFSVTVQPSSIWNLRPPAGLLLDSQRKLLIIDVAQLSLIFASMAGYNKTKECKSYEDKGLSCPER